MKKETITGFSLLLFSNIYLNVIFLNLSLKYRNTGSFSFTFNTG